jgi:type I restriction enzyme M protein
MLTNEIRNQIDQIWNAFWSGGISNPLEVIEQITYLLFIKRLDGLQTLEELKATRLKKPIERRLFPQGEDDHPRSPRSYEDYRWSRFKHFAPADIYEVVGEHVFPFLRRLGVDESTYAHHMKDARFTIPTPGLLAKVVDMIDQVPMEERDTKGDLYEYMLAKIATAGQNGQFRTPRHIIRLMVEMVAPKPTDVLCDPACATAGFLVAAGEYLREQHPEIFRDGKLSYHFHHSFFHGFDFDNTMLRIGSMNMLLHGVEIPTSAIATPSRKTTRARRKNTRSSSPIRRLPGRSTTRIAPRISYRSSRLRRPNSSSSRSSCACSSLVDAPPSLSRMVSSSARPARTRP